MLLAVDCEVDVNMGVEWNEMKRTNVQMSSQINGHRHGNYIESVPIPIVMDMWPKFRLVIYMYSYSYINIFFVIQ